MSELIDTDSLSYRLEYKYRSHQKSLPEMYDLLRVNPLSFEEVYGERTVNNIYLDHPSLKGYFQNLDGVADRVKYRIRWYGDRGSPQLELKIKRGALGSKIVAPIDALDVQAFLHRGDVREIISLVGNDAISELLKQLEPIVINNYSRRYLVSRNGKVRVTLDHGIRYKLFGHDSAGIADPATVIVEIKADRSEMDEVSRVGNDLPMRRERFSKYVAGLQLLFGA